MTPAALAAGTLVAGAPGSWAAFPGANGRIAFTSDRDGNNEIYVMDADGGAQTNLTNNGALDLDPAWSPDGTRIAFTSSRDSVYYYEIYVMDGFGGIQTNLTQSDLGSDIQPDWQPLPAAPPPPGPGQTSRGPSAGRGHPRAGARTGPLTP